MPVRSAGVQLVASIYYMTDMFNLTCWMLIKIEMQQENWQRQKKKKKKTTEKCMERAWKLSRQLPRSLERARYRLDDNASLLFSLISSTWSFLSETERPVGARESLPLRKRERKRGWKRDRNYAVHRQSKLREVARSGERSRQLWLVMCEAVESVRAKRPVSIWPWKRTQNQPAGRVIGSQECSVVSKWWSRCQAVEGSRFQSLVRQQPKANQQFPQWHRSCSRSISNVRERLVRLTILLHANY